jgi:hypothetical protein
MKVQLFFSALALHTCVPLIAGIVLFWVYIGIGSLEMVPNNSPAVKALIAKQSAVQRVGETIGMLLLVAVIAFLGQIVPCLATALLLGVLAVWLLPLSKALYAVLSAVIGTSMAALWFFIIGPGGLQVIAGILTIFAGIGFVLSSLIVCAINR